MRLLKEHSGKMSVLVDEVTDAHKPVHLAALPDVEPFLKDLKLATLCEDPIPLNEVIFTLNNWREDF
jgi:hypothetical protein